MNPVTIILHNNESKNGVTVVPVEIYKIVNIINKALERVLRCLPKNPLSTNQDYHNQDQHAEGSQSMA